MAVTLNQAIQPKVVGPLFILSVLVFKELSFFGMDLVPLSTCYIYNNIDTSYEPRAARRVTLEDLTRSS